MRFKVKVLKRFKFSTGCHIETCRSLKRRAFLKIPSTVFRRIYALSVCFKMKSLKKTFSSVTTKTNPNFAIKLAERSSHSLLLSIWWITFFKHLCSLIRDLNWLKQFFPVIIVKQLLISVSVIARWDSISAFSSLIGVPIGIVVL